MRVVRLYINQNLALHHEITLEDATLHYATNVLRLNKNSSLLLFNGDGSDYACEILSFKKKTAELRVIKKIGMHYIGNAKYWNILCAKYESLRTEYNKQFIV